MALPEIARFLYANPTYAKRIVHTETTEPESPRYGELDTPLSPGPLRHSSGRTDPVVFSPV